MHTVVVQDVTCHSGLPEFVTFVELFFFMDIPCFYTVKLLTSLGCLEGNFKKIRLTNSVKCCISPRARTNPMHIARVSKLLPDIYKIQASAR